MSQRAGVLFLCVANSARSQMAEGLARAMAPRGVPIASAGSAPRTVHPLAVRAMQEKGIDISAHHSKALADVELDRVHTVITLCAEEFCPATEIPERLHWPIDDPADADDTEAGRLAAFRRARDEIAQRLRTHFGW